MKIGALLPRSTFQPLLYHNFQQGLQAYLQYRQVPASLITAHIGFGTEPEKMLAEAEKMLLEQQVDVLVLYADQESVQNIASLARSLNRLVLLVHNGAKYPYDWEPHPVVLSHTLNNTVQCRLTGQYAAGLLKDAAVCTSFYDGGYSHSHALTQSYADCGGNIAYNFVSQYKVQEFNSAPLHDFLTANTQVQALLSLFNGDLAHCFLQQLQQLDHAKNLQVFASPMLLDETLPAVYGELRLPFRISGYVPWTSSINNDANSQLKEQFLHFTGREANLAGMHGWDTGLILEHIFNTANTHNFRAKDILAGLGNVTLNSPRGPMRIDTATHHMLTPAWLVEANEVFEPEVKGRVDNTATIWQEIVNDKTVTRTSGWINTYLCA
ncbi:ABC transporter substrate-binding protein [Chitinophaga tropicalis]|uniref:ABC transporter substrate-binding protein n=1 Tax=Chitinophaga tropicalis TaxID=2683588 RepID=A0A7K1U0I4_9BACT|nr:ABC transporter substrate-binding protein [Chitinophaga tropicalis]MVT07878.1 ABC transporter substrate-binding protein [Chitinophaga tropicalis]